jgi:type I restriction enzyme R subunit
MHYYGASFATRYSDAWSGSIAKQLSPPSSYLRQLRSPLPQVGAVDFKRFKRKARHFLLDHQGNLALQKLRRGKPLTMTDLQQLETLMISAGVGDRAQLDQAVELSSGLGRFIRSLVGLERGAVADAFSAFLNTGSASADQVEFIELVIEHLTHEGVMDPKLLYESPFTDIAPAGPEQVFPLRRTDELIDVIDSFNASAAAAS